MNFTQYCQHYNYPVESHQIITEDGYILTYFRIQAQNTTIIQKGLPVVYLQHGLIDSSDTWVVNYEDIAPGFTLSNKGYDVWLGNSRGNKYSLAHVNLSIHSLEFWNFTWQQMAEYDLPAAFDYIANYTEQKINYVGHSQGSLIIIAALSVHNAVIMKNLRTVCVLAPAVFINHMTSTILRNIAGTGFPNFLYDKDKYSITEPTLFSETLGYLMCTYLDVICIDAIGMISDADPRFDSVGRFNIVMSHFPSGTSTINTLHWNQMMDVPSNESVLSMYDYGTSENIKVYGTENPPVYDIGAVDVPIHLFVGEDDKLVDPVDANILRLQLTGSPLVTFNNYPLMGHASFVWGKNMSYFQDVIDVIENDIN